MSQPPDLIGLFIRPLEAAGVGYMITGGVAAVIYGDPRFTRDVDLAGEVPLHRWALDRLVRLRVGEGEISVAPIEYVILRKLQYYRDSGSDRHLRDIAMMLRFSGDAVDRHALDEWCRRLDLVALLQQAEDFQPGGTSR